jgi:hypothetical protein
MPAFVAPISPLLRQEIASCLAMTLTFGGSAERSSANTAAAGDPTLRWDDMGEGLWIKANLP